MQLFIKIVAFFFVCIEIIITFVKIKVCQSANYHQLNGITTTWDS